MMIVHAPENLEDCSENCKGCTAECPHDPNCEYLGKECKGCVNK